MAACEILSPVFSDWSSRKQELKHLFQLALPTMITQLLRFLNPSISIMVCGHLSREELDASSLAATLVNVLGLSIDTGFCTAFDTLFSQAYGSKEPKKLGIFLQRALCIITMMFTLLACCHLNIEPLLLLLRQDPLISSLTAEYLKCFLPGLACDFLFLTIGRYLQAQNIVLPMMFASGMGTIFNVILQYFVVLRFNFGLRASALCLSCAFAFMLFCELAWVYASKVYLKTRSDANIKLIFSNWWIILRLGVPGLFMVALEEWCFEMMTFIAGSLDEITLGAHAVAFQVQSMIYMVPLGIFTACNVRVGQNLGAFNPDGARFAYHTALGIVTIVALCTSLPVIILRRYIPYIFTEDEEVIELASRLLPMLLAFQLCEGFAGVSEAVILACGHQKFGAITIFIGYYVIGTPIALSLAYCTRMGIFGAWTGILVGFAVTTIVYTVYAFRTNWVAESHQAHRNIYGSPDTSPTCNGQTAMHFEALDVYIGQSEQKKPSRKSVLGKLSVLSHATVLTGKSSKLRMILRKISGSPLWQPHILYVVSLVSFWSVGLWYHWSRSFPFWAHNCTQLLSTVRPSYCERMLHEQSVIPFFGGQIMHTDNVSVDIWSSGML
ncbi:unnamed protein product [Calicophoron daubneyi]|uniref:Multidrug and toxin extrusion protein n=1 Tax=Calicophoron daubneyi TaxID=300641 RepID=A0AAV2TU46_CALDB